MKRRDLLTATAGLWLAMTTNPSLARALRDGRPGIPFTGYQSVAPDGLPLPVGQVLELRRQPVELYNPCGIDLWIGDTRHGWTFGSETLARRLDAGVHLAGRIVHRERTLPPPDWSPYRLDLQVFPVRQG